MDRKLIVILPAYNEESGIGELLTEFTSIVSQFTEYEIILVNDGSTDKTVDIASEYTDKLNLTMVNHTRNKGLGPAIKTGLHEVINRSNSPDDAVVYMDADCTHSPSYIPEMVRLIDDGADIVIASRFRGGSDEVGVPFMRRMYSRAARLVFRFFLPMPGVTDYTCGYRAYRAGLIQEALKQFGDRIIERTGFACTDEILVNLATFDVTIKEVPFVLRYDKKQGRSKLQLGLTIIETLKMLFRARKKLKAPKQPLPYKD
jgi:dolichol-phosphate mannosyltransferase